MKAEGLELGVGARLTRDWMGKTHEVIVEEGGFRWEGRTYRSLSAAAARRPAAAHRSRPSSDSACATSPSISIVTSCQGA